MLIAALLCLSAHAYELDVSIAVGGAAPFDVTLHDVEPGRVPGLMLPGQDEPSHRLLIELVDNDDGSFTFDLRLDEAEVGATRRGRERYEVIAAPRITVPLDQEAQVSQGPRGTDADGQPQPPNLDLSLRLYGSE